MGRVARNRTVERDLRGIVHFIASDNPSAAIHWIDEIERIFQLLADHSLSGEQLHSPRLGDVRRYVVGNYVVYFRPYTYGVRIVRVIHGARDHRRLI